METYPTTTRKAVSNTVLWLVFHTCCVRERNSVLLNFRLSLHPHPGAYRGRGRGGRQSQLLHCILCLCTRLFDVMKKYVHGGQQRMLYTPIPHLLSEGASASTANSDTRRSFRSTFTVARSKGSGERSSSPFVSHSPIANPRQRCFFALFPEMGSAGLSPATPLHDPTTW